MTALNLNHAKQFVRLAVILTVGYLLLTLSRPVNIPSVSKTSNDTLLIHSVGH